MSISGLTAIRPDFESPKEFQTWLIGQRTQRSDKEILETIRGPSPVDALRCASLSFWSKDIPKGSFLDYIGICLDSGNKAIEVYAKSIVSLHRLIEAYSLGDLEHRLCANSIVPLLQKSLQDLERLPKHDFVREVQSAVLVVLSQALGVLQKQDDAERQAAEALFWAQHIDAPISISRARSQLIQIALSKGQVADAIQLIYASQAFSHRLPHNAEYEDATLATCLFHLGALDLAFQTIDQLEMTSPTLRLQVARQRYKALAGIEIIDVPYGEGASGFAPSRWIADSLHKLLSAAALPRLNQFRDQRLALVQEALKIAQNASVFFTPWYEGLNRWIQATACLWHGNTIAAINSLMNMPTLNPQWLDLRVLIAGIRLELSLNLHHPELHTQLFEQELRDVFASAVTIPFASPQGLARLLMRWHPKAAAYAAVMPDPIYECQSATTFILRVGETNFLYGVPIAPAHAAELVLRDLGYDLRNQNFVQSRLNGDSRKRRDEALRQQDKVCYWKPAVSSISLIYGLLKADVKLSHYREAAEALKRDYGLRPKTVAMDVDMKQMKTLEQATRNLLSGFLTVPGFCAELL